MTGHGLERSATDSSNYHDDLADDDWQEYLRHAQRAIDDRAWELAYDASDPKHPGYYGMAVDLADERRKDIA